MKRMPGAMKGMSPKEMDKMHGKDAAYPKKGGKKK